jgi:cytochrome c-type biogenesis protein
MEFGAGTAFVGGLLTFASPCVLPLIPIYLSVLVGGSLDNVTGARDRFKLMLNGILFVVGFLLVFILLGMTASALGKFLIKYRLLFQQLGGMMVFFFGLKFLGIARLDILDREKRFNLTGGGKISPLGAVVIGFTFAFGWTPCIGPILGSILTFTAVSTTSLVQGAWLLFLYGLGLGVPLLLVALFAQTGTRWLRKLTRFIPRLEKATGAILILMSVMMITDSIDLLTFSAGSSSSAEISQEMVVNLKRPAVNRIITDSEMNTRTETSDGTEQQCTEDSDSCGLGEADDSFSEELNVSMSLGQLTQGPVILDFFKPDCPACMKMVPILQSVQTTCSGEGLRVEKIDISDPVNRRLAMQMGVVGTPTLLFFNEDGQEVARLVGAQELRSIQQAIDIIMGEVCADFTHINQAH